MTGARALDIVSMVNDMAFCSMGLWEEGKPLRSIRDVSLAEMLEAKRIVEEKNALPLPPPGGARTIHCVPDDRLIAAAYVISHYEPNGSPILMLPQQSVFHETSHVALGCVRLNPNDEDDVE